MPYQVVDIKTEVRKILGACDEDHMFERISQAVEVLSHSGDFDPLLGYLDICVDSQCVTLPREVETVLAVNIAGRPAIGRDQFFSFHLNGPGDTGGRIAWEWSDQPWSPLYRDLVAPTKLVAFLASEEDENKELWVYGYDENQKWVRSQNAAGLWVNGYQVPTIFGVAVPDDGAPTFTRVTRVRKVEFVDDVRLASYDNDDASGTLLGIYEWDETDPMYRRIKLGHEAEWVRIGYKKRVYSIKSETDLIPLPSRVPLFMMLRALVQYDDKDIVGGAEYEAHARRLLTEAIWSQQSPVTSPLQVNDSISLVDRFDDVD